MDKIFCKEASVKGLRTYFTGKPCKHEHIAERFTRNRVCIVCDAIYAKEYSKARYHANIDSEREYRRLHYLKNKQAYIEAARRNEKPYARKTEGVRDKSKSPHYWSAKVAEHRAGKKQRTPTWADLEAIEQFYRNCPAGYEVDHVIPLNGTIVSGLHVLNNLQYLTRSENASKGNRYAP